MAERAGPRLARLGPRAVLVLAALAVALSAAFAVVVARHLTADAEHASRLYARVYAGLSSPRAGAETDALLALAAEIRREGIPLVLTDPNGVPTDTANLPFTLALDSPELAAYVARLDRLNRPVSEPTVGTVHFGSPPARGVLRLFLAGALAALVGVVASAFLAYRAALRAARDRIWVAMARESAHQLGTPLTSMAGWIAQLRQAGNGTATDAAHYLEGDWKRLDRVARRFERIGQPAAREPVDVGALAGAVAAYFRPRLPTLAHNVALEVLVGIRAPIVSGDPLLLEWALEALVKNAVDALKGRSGSIRISVLEEPAHVVIAVSDDGPGVPRAMRSRLFEPGTTTKTGGWGLGLALARRIIESAHGGRLTLEPTAVGARFAARLPRSRAPAAAPLTVTAGPPAPPIPAS